MRGINLIKGGTPNGVVYSPKKGFSVIFSFLQFAKRNIIRLTKIRDNVFHNEMWFKQNKYAVIAQYIMKKHKNNDKVQPETMILPKEKS